MSLAEKDAGGSGYNQYASSRPDRLEGTTLDAGVHGMKRSWDGFKLEVKFGARRAKKSGQSRTRSIIRARLTFSARQSNERFSTCSDIPQHHHTDFTPRRHRVTIVQQTRRIETTFSWGSTRIPSSLAISIILSYQRTARASPHPPRIKIHVVTSFLVLTISCK